HRLRARRGRELGDRPCRSHGGTGAQRVLVAVRRPRRLRLGLRRPQLHDRVRLRQLLGAVAGGHHEQRRRARGGAEDAAEQPAADPVGDRQRGRWPRLHGGAPAPPPPPSVTIAFTTPTAGATVKNTVAVSAAATGSGIATVVFRLDGGPLGPTFTTAPYAFGWDTRPVATGGHTLAVLALDG